jgi:hypothetical protein
MMEHMKGVSRTVAVCETEKLRLELELYSDQSWGIRRQGQTIGVWEPHEKEECFRVFGMLAGLDEPMGGPNLIVLAPKGTVARLTTWENVN